MPFVLKHKESAQIYTCTLINIYKLPYYGTQFWDSLQEAEEELPVFLEQEQVNDAKLWELYEITEQKLKVCNVKLNNNEMKVLYLNDEKIPTVKNRESK
ncbi:hypothetical protein [Chengkuizengella axinellae]|uniref:Uncharacterized protein n=1 Tax=Chengkuizengella axinellae TaxID=3064388 RepID=A0ABT9IZB9_9BACL|nr:hypothetical protein [Chengkuizengella sp. 2205SS18-9]MDP5274125.1 hypothetical protein [Chengkuizengella sp. 2205SS18-9]